MVVSGGGTRPGPTPSTDMMGHPLPRPRSQQHSGSPGFLDSSDTSDRVRLRLFTTRFWRAGQVHYYGTTGQACVELRAAESQNLTDKLFLNIILYREHFRPWGHTSARKDAGKLIYKILKVDVITFHLDFKYLQSLII